MAIQALRSTGATVATAESLTGGLVCAALTSVPGSSRVVRGGVVVYATDLKGPLAGVDHDVLERCGPVSSEVVAAMAAGARVRLDAVYGLATTGVAGPDPQDSRPPGTVHVAVAGPDGVVVRSMTGANRLTGDRDAIRDATVESVLELLTDAAVRSDGSS